jgi:hypothetical protein
VTKTAPPSSCIFSLLRRCRQLAGAVKGVDSQWLSCLALAAGIGWTVITTVAMFALTGGNAQATSRLDHPVLTVQRRVALIDSLLAARPTARAAAQKPRWLVVGGPRRLLSPDGRTPLSKPAVRYSVIRHARSGSALGASIQFCSADGLFMAPSRKRTKHPGKQPLSPNTI